LISGKKPNIFINPLEKYPLALDEYGEPIHTISYIREYVTKDHAWTGDYYNVKEFEEETLNPTIDYKALGAALAQVSTASSLNELALAPIEVQR
jgi:hypothetical protein